MFSWGVAATVGTALGTTLLAIGTLSLALGTRELARTARLQVAVEQNALAASFRPLLLNVPAGYGSQPGRVAATEAVLGIPELVSIDRVSDAYRFELPVRNAGEGVAFIQGASVQWKGEQYGGRARNGILPPGEFTNLVFQDLPDDGEFASPERTRRFTVSVVYEDLGRNPWETDIDIKWREKAGNWTVIAVANRSVGAPDDQTVKSGDMWEE